MRLNLFVRGILLSIVVALSACEKSLPERPQLFVDRDVTSDGGVDFGRAFIGTKPQESLMMENQGLSTLEITDVSRKGDGAFSIMGPTKTALELNDRSFVQIIFTPTEAKAYSATLTITSNAENAPTKTIPLAGEGVAP